MRSIHTSPYVRELLGQSLPTDEGVVDARDFETVRADELERHRRRESIAEGRASVLVQLYGGDPGNQDD